MTQATPSCRWRATIMKLHGRTRQLGSGRTSTTTRPACQSPAACRTAAGPPARAIRQATMCRLWQPNSCPSLPSVVTAQFECTLCSDERRVWRRTSQTNSVRVVSNTVRNTAPRCPAPKCRPNKLPQLQRARLAVGIKWFLYGVNAAAVGLQTSGATPAMPLISKKRTRHTHAGHIVHEQRQHVHQQHDCDEPAVRDHLQMSRQKGGCQAVHCRASQLGFRLRCNSTASTNIAVGPGEKRLANDHASLVPHQNAITSGDHPRARCRGCSRGCRCPQRRAGAARWAASRGTWPACPTRPRSPRS